MYTPAVDTLELSCPGRESDNVLIWFRRRTLLWVAFSSEFSAEYSHSGFTNLFVFFPRNLYGTQCRGGASFTADEYIPGSLLFHCIRILLIHIKKNTKYRYTHTNIYNWSVIPRPYLANRMDSISEMISPKYCNVTKLTMTHISSYEVWIKHLTNLTCFVVTSSIVHDFVLYVGYSLASPFRLAGPCLARSHRLEYVNCSASVPRSTRHNVLVTNLTSQCLLPIDRHLRK